MATIDSSSYWADNTPAPRFSALKEDIAVDVLVIGAGITGITAAYLLKRAGYNVALVEKGRCLSGDTSYTTAHLTCVTDTLLSDLVTNFGEDHAQAVWDAQLSAIDMVDRIVWREQIKCQFDWVPAYLFNPLAGTGRDHAVDLQKEANLATKLGFDAELVARAPLVNQPAVRYDNQAKFHPRKYLVALLRLLCAGKGCHVYEQTNVDEIEGTPITATTSNGARIHCEHVLIATHVPLQGKSGLLPATVLQSKLAPYSSYVVGGWVPRGTVHEGLYWDTGDPYDYVRVDRRHDHDFIIFGGEDHKTGQVEQTTDCFSRLEQRLKSLLPEIAITHRWSGQVIETNDGLPYIGETAERQYVATGFGGNGMTFGTLSAMMFTDHVAGTNESVGRAVRRRAHEDQRRALELPEGKQGLPVLPDPRSICRHQRALAARDQARPWRSHRGQRPAGRRLSRSRQPDPRAVSDLHAPGLLCALQRGGAHLGLPLSRLAL